MSSPRVAPFDNAQGVLSLSKHGAIQTCYLVWRPI
jgi:hypothetical protein